MALAGTLIIIASFLPWIHASPGAVEDTGRSAFVGSESPRDYSGWDLADDCGQWNGAITCSVGIVEGRRSILTGPATATMGVVLLALGVDGAWSIRRDRRATARIVLAVSCLTAGAAAGFATLFRVSAGKLDYRIGVNVLWLASLLAVAGAAIATAAGGRRHATRTAGRLLGAFGLAALGWFGAVLLSTA